MNSEQLKYQIFLCFVKFLRLILSCVSGFWEKNFILRFRYRKKENLEFLFRYLDDISLIGAPNRPSLYESLLDMIKALDAENDEVKCSAFPLRIGVPGFRISKISQL